MYDIIGDIHGHADELKALMGKLEYKKRGDSFHRDGRQVIFVGDYIDRGPKIRETLEIVKGMVDAGDAIALMGNHEYNAICYHMPDANGGYLRKHSEKNNDQHRKTLEQFAGRDEELKYYTDWFMTLPLFYETERFRVVHACWDFHSIRLLNKALDENRLTYSVLHDAHNGNEPLFNALEITLKGKELKLPDGHSFIDKDGHKRSEIRVKWWTDPRGKTYKEYSIIQDSNLPTDQVNSDGSEVHYNASEVPVFFGHYWLEPNPSLSRPNICCLDYSVAKEGKLVAYQYQGEPNLDDRSFCC